MMNGLFRITLACSVLLAMVLVQEIEGGIDTCTEAQACVSLSNQGCKDGKRKICVVRRTTCPIISSSTRVCAPGATPAISLALFTAPGTTVCGYFTSSPAVFGISDPMTVTTPTPSTTPAPIIAIPFSSPATCTLMFGACGLPYTGVRITYPFSACPTTATSTIPPSTANPIPQFPLFPQIIGGGGRRRGFGGGRRRGRGGRRGRFGRRGRGRGRGRGRCTRINRRGVCIR
ncbi:hypothetical protein EB796_005750 [Bugula neritina]|uniref:Uncharacterized protein n=1 Tax=Bugula neritina TaxID=10212 RepID=A0A7J7KEP0_BUGNE|nr:hypothetical protein EB796_005750 [Bugula neritina]